MSEFAEKKKRTEARGWRAEMYDNVEQACKDLQGWLNPDTRHHQQLDRAVRRIEDAKRIEGYANDLEGISLKNYVEKALQEASD